MKLSDKHKGKTFADLSKIIENKYKNRYDAISKRSRMSELESLKKEQEKVKLNEEFRNKFKETVQQMVSNQNSNDFNNDESGNNDLPLNEKMNHGGSFHSNRRNVRPNDYIQDEKGFNKFKSSNYNDQYLSNFEDYKPTLKSNTNFEKERNRALENDDMFEQNESFSDLISKTLKNDDMFQQNESFSDSANKALEDDDLFKLHRGFDNNMINALNEDNNVNKLNFEPMRGVGTLMNVGQLLSMKKPGDVRDQLSDSFVSAPRFTKPSRQYFNKIDFSNIQNVINTEASTASQTNRNISGGNAGSFLSNQQAISSNVMDAISKARMNEQMSNNQITAMNAQEQSKVDQMKYQQELAKQQAKNYNSGIEMRIEDINSRNLGAYNTNKSALISKIGEQVDSMTKEKMLSDSVAKALGYPMSGKHNSSDKLNFLGNLFK